MLLGLVLVSPGISQSDVQSDGSQRGRIGGWVAGGGLSLLKYMMSFFVFVVFSVRFWTLFLLADSSHPANLIIKLAGWGGAVAVEYWSHPTA